MPQDAARDRPDWGVGSPPNAEDDTVHQDSVSLLLALIDETVAHLADGANSNTTANSTASVYSSAFPIGEALGRRFRRCCNGTGPFGLAILLERIVDGPSTNPADARAVRRGLFSGFCWELERALGSTHPWLALKSGQEQPTVEGLHQAPPGETRER